MKPLLILILSTGCFPLHTWEPVAIPVPTRRLEMNHEEAQAMIRLVLKERDEKRARERIAK